jgi:hypothetical protein
VANVRGEARTIYQRGTGFGGQMNR